MLNPRPTNSILSVPNPLEWVQPAVSNGAQVIALDRPDLVKLMDPFGIIWTIVKSGVII